MFSVAVEPPEGIDFPYGVVAFTVTQCQPDAVIDVSIDFGETLPADATAWKTDPWTQISGATITGSVLSYSVTDGGPNDADGSINGVIVDPVGVGVPADEPVDEALDESADEPVDEPVVEPVDEPTDESVAVSVTTQPFGALLMLFGLMALIGTRRVKTFNAQR